MSSALSWTSSDGTVRQGSQGRLWNKGTYLRFLSRSQEPIGHHHLGPQQRITLIQPGFRVAVSCTLEPTRFRRLTDFLAPGCLIRSLLNEAHAIFIVDVGAPLSRFGYLSRPRRQLIVRPRTECVQPGPRDGRVHETMADIRARGHLSSHTAPSLPFS